VAEYDFIIQHGIDLPPDFVAERGYFKYRALDFEGCIADCTVALAIKPDLTRAIYNRAAALKESGNEEAALQDLRKLLEIDPRHEHGLYLQALLLGDTGQWEQALAAWNSYMEIRPDDWRPRLFRGIAFAELGDRQEAVNEYLKGSAIRPKMRSFYFRRHYLYKEMNLPELAQKEWAAALAIVDEPDDSPLGDPRDPATKRAEEKLHKLLSETSKGGTEA
jgi:tetratricopeptide (TPR) repeat protein